MPLSPSPPLGGCLPTARAPCTSAACASSLSPAAAAAGGAPRSWWLWRWLWRAAPAVLIGCEWWALQITPLVDATLFMLVFVAFASAAALFAQCRPYASRRTNTLLARAFALLALLAATQGGLLACLGPITRNGGDSDANSYYAYYYHNRHNDINEASAAAATPFSSSPAAAAGEADTARRSRGDTNRVPLTTLICGGGRSSSGHGSGVSRGRGGGDVVCLGPTAVAYRRALEYLRRAVLPPPPTPLQETLAQSKEVGDKSRGGPSATAMVVVWAWEGPADRWLFSGLPHFISTPAVSSSIAPASWSLLAPLAALLGLRLAVLAVLYGLVLWEVVVLLRTGGKPDVSTSTTAAVAGRGDDDDHANINIDDNHQHNKDIDVDNKKKMSQKRMKDVETSKVICCSAGYREDLSSAAASDSGGDGPVDCWVIRGFE